MNGTQITVVGNVVNSPSRNRTQNGSVTNFRVASTERRYDRSTETWGNGNSFFVDVECWGDLGGNVSHSISKGDPVVVVGTIRTDEWESDEGRRSRSRVRADAVAPNLARGVAEFRKTQRSEPRADEPPVPTDPGAQEFDDGEPRAGRDYQAAVEALDHVNADDLTGEPAHA
ncbi:single-stranded DNA-binding protein [Blastococcus sp. TF02A-30]|uniref:single-stranded DNA-binding protein n=1 Tax=Blastococcus sp. TF02A-30 TaxID=2250580 RepID=UPI000DE99C4F|nr:single-stranded DNA-binding protein [Blastococcus sp. TF02A-30]RBY84971.1 single-stranded DNA-binding protein [Blastococcus sp. TF02A-30]